MIEARYPKVLAWAKRLLRDLLGEDAEFRPGQYEAIESACTRPRTLVVQRTGWGKSLVYFIATKMLRVRGHGPTLVVSPLIALMDNQLAAARSLGLVAEVLNSTVERERRPEIITSACRGEIDLLFTTPETLFTADVSAAFTDLSVSLLVIDEAHCISDWGHDFRLEYTRLRSLLPKLGAARLLATTATATDAVVDDICQQLGGDVFVLRGPLVRESLRLQVVSLTNAPAKYAWLAANLARMEGSGIIYCTTIRDCDRLAAWLTACGYACAPYHSRRDALERQETLAAFDANRLKALVATSALGMGYDKDDIAFVVHFQLPAGIVDYYQQIGRAGRGLACAYAILMYGDAQDLAIQRYFIDSAFPSEAESTHVEAFVRAAPQGVRFQELLASANMSRSRLNKALDFLENDGYVYRDAGRYLSCGTPFVYDRAHYDAISARRRAELEELRDLCEGDGCLSQGIVRALGDMEAPACGRCARCTGADVFDMAEPIEADLARATAFIEGDLLTIAPRKRWPSRELAGRLGDATTIIAKPNEEGLCLVRRGFGELGSRAWRDVEEGEPFDATLVERAATLLAPHVRRLGIGAVVPVPSTRCLTSLLADELAHLLELPLADVLAGEANPSPQREQANAYYQCKNACDTISALPFCMLPEAILIVDDFLDSGWTLTVAGARARQECGASTVLPFALVDGRRA